MKRKELKRVFEVLQSDKALLGEGAKALIEQDLTKKLEEYFEVSKGVALSLVFENGRYFVTVEFEAERIKKFSVIP